MSDNPQDVIARGLDEATFHKPLSGITQQGRADARTALDALATAGFVVVPSEPSDDDDIERAAKALAREYGGAHGRKPLALDRRVTRVALDAFLAPYRSTEDR